MKPLLWLLCAAPFVDLMARAFGLGATLGANPQEAILRATGTWSLTLLLVTLGVTPVRRWANWVELVRVRRLLGLWSFAYACIHLLAFGAFEHGFDLQALILDATKRPFVTLGLTAFALMLPMAATSNNRAMRALGPRWKQWHRLIYVVAVLACIHFFLHRAGKNNFLDPALASAVTVAFLGLRLWWWRTQPSPARSRI